MNRPDQPYRARPELPATIRRRLLLSEAAGYIAGPGAYLVGRWRIRHPRRSASRSDKGTSKLPPVSAWSREWPGSEFLHRAVTTLGREEERLQKTTAIWCGQLELSAPDVLPRHPQHGDGSPYTQARILLRIHGEAVGYVFVDIGLVGLEQARVLAAADNDTELVGRVRRHLAADGLSAMQDLRHGLSEVRLAAVDWPTAEGEPRPSRNVSPKVRGACVDNGIRSGRDTAVYPDRLISIIVCTRDRPDSLLICLHSLKNLLHPHLEAVIVDNAPSDDGAARVFQKIVGDDSRFRYVRENRAGLSFARNAGIAAATGLVTAFTDDDVEVDPGWLNGILRGFSRRDTVACVTGLVAAANLDSAAEQYFDARVAWSTRCEPRLFDGKLATHSGPLHPFAAGSFGALVAVRTTLLRELGGFDNALGVGTPSRGGEDLDLLVRILLAGHVIAYEPAAVSWHHHRGDFPALRRQMFGYGCGLSAYLTKYLLNPRISGRLILRLPAGVMHLRRLHSRTCLAKTE